jgi:L-phenylalanine/L-methionine N-acetyltransferase
MTAPLVIRRVEPGDFEIIARTLGEPAVYPGTLQLPYPSLALWQERMKAPPAPGSIDLFLLALRGNQPVGNASLNGAGTSPRRRHVASLGIVVAGAAQGQGVGTALMQALMEHADLWAGILRIELQVFADNHRAIALYRRFGFEVEGTHRAYSLRDGVYVNSLSMARLHPDPPALPS